MVITIAVVMVIMSSSDSSPEAKLHAADDLGFRGAGIYGLSVSGHSDLGLHICRPGVKYGRGINLWHTLGQEILVRVRERE